MEGPFFGFWAGDQDGWADGEEERAKGLIAYVQKGDRWDRVSECDSTFQTEQGFLAADDGRLGRVVELTHSPSTYCSGFPSDLSRTICSSFDSCSGTDRPPLRSATR